MKIAHTDIDIDVANRDALLQYVKHTRAYGEKDGVHKVGIYAQGIPYNPKLDAAAVEFKEAEEYGFFKFDIINNSVYDNVKDDAHLERAMREPDWSLLEDKQIVEQLVHIHDYASLVGTMKPSTVEELAMVLALIRPAKNYLIGKSWGDIRADIWVKPVDGGYYFKKAHAIAFAVSIVVQLNILVHNDT